MEVTTMKLKSAVLAAALVLVSASFASANLVWFSPLDPTAAPPSSMGGYALSGAGVDPRPTGIFVDHVDGLTFSEDVIHSTIGDGWATWSHSYTGDVYKTPDSTDPDSLGMDLPSGIHAFYFYAEPNIFSTFSLTAVADGGSVLLTQLVAGFAGAKFFGVYDDSGGTIDSILVTGEHAAGGFAVGEFGADVRIQQTSEEPVPEPASLLLMGMGLTGLAARRRLRATA